MKKVLLKTLQYLQEMFVLESLSLFNHVEGLRPVTLLKRDTSTGIFLRILRNF